MDDELGPTEDLNSPYKSLLVPSALVKRILRKGGPVNEKRNCCSARVENETHWNLVVLTLQNLNDAYLRG